jgi:hypothetical protein
MIDLGIGRSVLDRKPPGLLTCTKAAFISIALSAVRRATSCQPALSAFQDTQILMRTNEKQDEEYKTRLLHLVRARPPTAKWRLPKSSVEQAHMVGLQCFPVRELDRGSRPDPKL